MARDPVRLLNDASESPKLRGLLEHTTTNMYPPLDAEPGLAKLRARLVVAEPAPARRAVVWTAGGVATALLVLGAASIAHRVESRAPGETSDAAEVPFRGATASTLVSTQASSLGAADPSVVTIAPLAAVMTSSNVVPPAETTSAPKSMAASVARGPTSLATLPPASSRGVEGASTSAPAAAKAPSISSARRSVTSEDLQKSESDADEITQLAEIRRRSRRDPGNALALAEDGDRRFPRGQLHQEREALAIESLVRLGRGEEARTRTDRFVESFPRSPFNERLRAIVDAR